MKTSLVHIIRSIGILIWISHLIIDISPRSIRWHWVDVCHANVPVRLGHTVHCINTSKLSRRVSSFIGQEAPWIARHHGSSVLVCDSVLCLSHPLLLIEASRTILDIRVVPVVTLLFLSLISYKYYVWLVYGCLVWATVWSLLVASLASANRGASWGPTVLVQATYRVATDILRWLSKVE